MSTIPCTIISERELAKDPLDSASSSRSASAMRIPLEMSSNLKELITSFSSWSPPSVAQSRSHPWKSKFMSVVELWSFLIRFDFDREGNIERWLIKDIASSFIALEISRSFGAEICFCCCCSSCCCFLVELLVNSDNRCILNAGKHVKIWNI